MSECNSFSFMAFMPSIFQQLKLRPLLSTDRAEVNRMLLQYPPVMYEDAFFYLFARNNPTRWIGHYSDSLNREHLLLGRHEGNSVCLLQPIGCDPLGVIREISKLEGVSWQPDPGVAFDIADEVMFRLSSSMDVCTEEQKFESAV